jgi:acyl dehydratase
MSTTAPGSELPSFTMRDIDLDRINEFMDLMGDTNPVHNDPELVEKLGLRGPVAQGPASLAYVINMLLGWQPDGMLERLSFRFEDVVTVGDEPTARGVVASVEDGRAVVDLSLALQTGATAVGGTATIRLPEAK